MKIRIKYCGGCNPHIDRTKVVTEVCRLLEKEFAVSVVSEDQKADICLLVCGCSALCLDDDKYRLNCKKYVLVGGNLVDYEAVNIDGLAEHIAFRIKDKLR